LIILRSKEDKITIHGNTLFALNDYKKNKRFADNFNEKGYIVFRLDVDEDYLHVYNELLDMFLYSRYGGFLYKQIRYELEDRGIIDKTDKVLVKRLTDRIHGFVRYGNTRIPNLKKCLMINKERFDKLLACTDPDKPKKCSKNLSFD